jgi:hypothetical protein
LPPALPEVLDKRAADGKALRDRGLRLLSRSHGTQNSFA